MSITDYAGLPVYDTFLIMLLSSQPVYDLNPLRPNPNPKKPVSGSCCVHRLGRALTALVICRCNLYRYGSRTKGEKVVGL